ncbi:MAG: hypothetical protein HY000_22545 [Planctomycetes bacterium]|nr:hypothetical protein [Planctomycetota bacterium]
MPRVIRTSRRLVLIAAACVLLLPALCGRTRADDVKSLPSGLRVFYTGHSFHMFVAPRIEQLVKSAGIEGHRLVGTQGIGGSRVIQHWDLADDKNKAKPALTTGQIDVFTMAAHLEIPDPGIDKLTELGLKHNPNLRLLVQASWMPFDLTASQQRIKDNAKRDNTNLDELSASTTAWRKKMEAQIDDLNRQHGRRALYIIPVGDAVIELRRLVAAGKFPGVRKQAELFRDPIGHGLGHVQSLAAYCNFTAIYRRSPEGLKLVEPGVSDDQHAILQRIAWETVSKYDHSGIPQ